MLSRFRLRGVASEPARHDTCAHKARLVHLAVVPASFYFLLEQIDYVQERGLEVHCITSTQETFGVPDPPAPLHAVPMSRSIAPLRDLFSLVRLWRTFRRIRPDIVHAHMSKAGLLGSIAARLARVPIVLYDNQGSSFITATGWRRRLVLAAERLTCRLSDGIQIASHSARSAFLEQGLCDASKIKVLADGGYGVDSRGRFDPDSLPHSTRSETRERWGIPEEASVIGFVGRLSPVKGIPQLLRAWPTLRGSHPEARLLLVGCEDHLTPLPPQTMRALESDPRVVVTGWTDDPRPCYAAMDVLVLPSAREGLPVSLLEGASMRLPIVGTRVTGIVDAVTDGETGTLVPAGDVDALREAISRYLGDPSLRRQHGDAGRERALRLFQRDRICEAFYQEYLLHLRAKKLA